MDGSDTERYETVIVGGGQAGLSMGYQLARRGLPFVILDAGERVGDAWRTRWDSLRLFTPARYSSLAGMPFPTHWFEKPTKDQMADYLEAYAAQFELPVRRGMKVDGLARQNGRFVVTAGDRLVEADRVIVATGAYQEPWAPPFAQELDSGIVQMHSSAYRNPAQLQSGPVLVVGAGNSGADISIEVVRGHQTFLSGRHPGHLPFRIDSFKARFLVRVVRFVGQHVLTRRTPIGRKVVPMLLTRGSPLIRVKPKDIAAAGIERVPRVAGVRDGLPLLEDGRVLEVTNVIWCTGFRQDHSWIDFPVFGDDGEPIHDRGIVARAPGLYFLGLPFQYAATSEVITGVGRDAEYIANHIAKVAAGEPNGRSALRSPVRGMAR